MNVKQGGLVALLSVTVALGGTAATTPASAHMLAAPKKPYGCDIHPEQKKCQTGIGGIRVVGGANGVSTGQVGGTRTNGGANGTGGIGQTGGTRTNTGSSGTGGIRRNTTGSGAGKNGGNGQSNAGANGAGPGTGYGGTTGNAGASPRSVAAGSQPVVVGLASPGSQQVTALPATGGGVPSQPASPLLALIACGLAVLGLGLRKVTGRS